MQYEDDKKTRPQLIAELQSLRAQFAAMQSHSAEMDSPARVGENHYRRLFEIAQDGVVVHELSTNPSGCRFLQANPGICRMLGYTSEEMLRLSPIDIQSEQGRQDVPAEAQTMDRQRRLLFRKVLVAKDGRRIPVEIHSTVFDQDGKTYCLSIIRGISERLAAEQAIRKSEAMLAHAQRIANIGSWEWDIPTGELLWSDQIYRIFGLDPKEFHPRHESFHTLVDPKDRDRVQQAIGQALAGKLYCVEFSITRPDSSVRRILSQGELEVDERGNPLQMFGTAMDITARKQADERLAGSERQLAEAQRLAHLGSWHWNITTNSVRWSDEHYRICGLRPDGSALTSERAIGCVHPDDREMLMARIDAALDGTAPYDCQFRVLRTDGTICWAHTRGEVVRDSSGRPIEMFGTILDIHAQKEAERQLREAKEAAEQANQAKDQLLAIVSHELRTPLADSGCFDVLVSDIGLPDGSGWDLMRRLRAKTGIAGIAISGYGTDEDLRISRDAGFAEHLVKPLNVQQLAAAITTVTNDHPADGSGHEKRGRGG